MLRMAALVLLLLVSPRAGAFCLEAHALLGNPLLADPNSDRLVTEMHQRFFGELRVDEIVAKVQNDPLYREVVAEMPNANPTRRLNEFYRRAIGEALLRSPEQRPLDLKRALQAQYGVTVPAGQTPRSVVQSLSRRNLDRYRWEPEKLTEIPAEVRDKIADIRRRLLQHKLRLVHNSQERPDLERLPLLPANVLARLGVPTLGNKYPFNQKLQSDGQLYFFTQFQAPGTEVKLSSGYGKHMLSPTEETMQREAWVSPFVMYTSDVTDFLKVHGSKPPSPGEVDRFVKDGNLPEAWKADLARFIFTADDYPQFVANKISLRMLEVFQQGSLDNFNRLHDQLKQRLETSPGALVSQHGQQKADNPFDKLIPSMEGKVSSTALPSWFRRQ